MSAFVFAVKCFLTLICSTLFCISGFLGYDAVNYLSYPLTLVFSSSKILIAMPASFLINSQKHNRKNCCFGYSLKEVLLSLLLLSGLLSVLLPTQSEAENRSQIGLRKGFTWKGAAMMLGSINISCIFDSLQSTMIQSDTKQRSFPFILFWGMTFSSLLYLIAMIFSGTIISTINVMTQHWDIFFTIVFSTLSHTLGQFLIVSLKTNYGIWWKNVVTSLRKCLSVVISVVFFGHSVTKRQFLGLIIVFVAVFLAGNTEMNRDKTEEHSTDNNTSKPILPV
ncbi:putative UAA transporter family [Monocercomonoides exilis]|uniref:putative UAA transporter family n=1 Tax=Monocercomonoides exilis TaxID=2049356 RepID=UPI0035593FD8|nr:putative UAA transporter family [Monocercomonoides exilis]